MTYRDHLKDNPWEDIFKFSASAAAKKLCEWVQVGIDVSLIINIRPCLIHPHGVQLLVMLPQFIEITFFIFHFHQQNKSSESNVKFRKVSNCCKSVLEVAKLPYANKTSIKLLANC